MKIHLPNSAFLGNIDPFFRTLDVTSPDKLKITTNKKWTSIHPVVLSMIGAIGLTVNPSKINFEKPEAKSKYYLKRMGLFKLLKIPSDIKMIEHDPAGRFIPLTQITDSTALTKFITDMIPLLHLKLEHAESIRYIVTELVQNVLDHSLSPNGALVSAQYYEKSNSIRIGIADTGLGIKKTISRSYPANSDLAAIRLALSPGITGTTKKEGGTELNAGAGLFFIRSIAKVNRNYFMIYSGKAMYKLLKAKITKKTVSLHGDPFADRFSKEENFPFWQGTAVGIDISLDTTKEFGALLDLIRKTYTKTEKERKKARHKKARFI
ncbi:MAG: sensor histidine kinase [Candidatus Omnitrophica bacterium]|nr:sensor histidine kinase [Candidatus Omnitrophota bacterium]